MKFDDMARAKWLSTSYMHADQQTVIGVGSGVADFTLRADNSRHRRRPNRPSSRDM